MPTNLLFEGLREWQKGIDKAGDMRKGRGEGKRREGRGGENWRGERGRKMRSKGQMNYWMLAANI